MVVSDRVRRLVTPFVDQIVYASTAYTDLKSTLNQQSRKLVDMTNAAGGPADERLRAALALMRPYRLVGRELIRVGGAHDGGYLMAPDLENARGAISLGVGPDVSWDVDVGSRGIRVTMFDPTVRRPPARVPNGVFHRLGVCGRGNATQQFRPLDELVEMAGLAESQDLLLKMDVEGAEWPTLSTLRRGELSPYRQIVLELHNLGRLANSETATPILTALRAVRDTHLPVHVHANNYSRLHRFADDWFPDAVEVSFVRRDVAGEVAPAECVHSPLDVPSDQRVAEIDLEGMLGVRPLPV